MREHGDRPIVVVNGWVARLRALRALAQVPGGVSLAVLLFVAGLITGWLPSPLTTLVIEQRQEHGLLAQRLAGMESTTSRLASAVEQCNRAEQLRICSEIQNVGLRQVCLDRAR